LTSTGGGEPESDLSVAAYAKEAAERQDNVLFLPVFWAKQGDWWEAFRQATQ
jgi:hypothetical protein